MRHGGLRGCNYDIIISIVVIIAAERPRQDYYTSHRPRRAAYLSVRVPFTAAVACNGKWNNGRPQIGASGVS